MLFYVKDRARLGEQNLPSIIYWCCWVGKLAAKSSTWPLISNVRVKGHLRGLIMPLPSVQHSIP
eukprot:3024294-Amphidinium_carterae.1